MYTGNHIRFFSKLYTVFKPIYRYKNVYRQEIMHKFLYTGKSIQFFKNHTHSFTQESIKPYLWFLQIFVGRSRHQETTSVGDSNRHHTLPTKQDPGHCQGDTRTEVVGREELAINDLSSLEPLYTIPVGG